MSMSDQIDLSVVIAAYQEEENLRLLLPRVVNELGKLGLTFEVLIIETVQPLDNTAEVCRQVGVGCFNRKPTNCFGDAIRTGIQLASGERILFMDADGSHSPEFIHSLLNESEGNDVIIASRYVPGGTTDNGKILILMSLVVNLGYSIVLNLNCKDVSNSFKLYRAHDLKQLDLRCRNFDIVEEILFKLKRNNPGLRIKEVPFTFKQRMFGHTKRDLISFVFSYFVTLIRLRFGR